MDEVGDAERAGQTFRSPQLGHILRGDIIPVPGQHGSAIGRIVDDAPGGGIIGPVGLPIRSNEGRIRESAALGREGRRSAERNPLTEGIIRIEAERKRLTNQRAIGDLIQNVLTLALLALQTLVRVGHHQRSFIRPPQRLAGARGDDVIIPDLNPNEVVGGDVAGRVGAICAPAAIGFRRAGGKTGPGAIGRPTAAFRVRVLGAEGQIVLNIRVVIAHVEGIDNIVRHDRVCIALRKRIRHMEWPVHTPKLTGCVVLGVHGNQVPVGRNPSILIHNVPGKPARAVGRVVVGAHLVRGVHPAGVFPSNHKTKTNVFIANFAVQNALNRAVFLNPVIVIARQITRYVRADVKQSRLRPFGVQLAHHAEETRRGKRKLAGGVSRAHPPPVLRGGSRKDVIGDRRTQIHAQVHLAVFPADHAVELLIRADFQQVAGNLAIGIRGGLPLQSRTGDNSRIVGGGNQNRRRGSAIVHQSGIAKFHVNPEVNIGIADVFDPGRKLGIVVRCIHGRNGDGVHRRRSVVRHLHRAAAAIVPDSVIQEGRHGKAHSLGAGQIQIGPRHLHLNGVMLDADGSRATGARPIPRVPRMMIGLDFSIAAHGVDIELIFREVHGATASKVAVAHKGIGIIAQPIHGRAARAPARIQANRHKRLGGIGDIRQLDQKIYTLRIGIDPEFLDVGILVVAMVHALFAALVSPDVFLTRVNRRIERDRRRPQPVRRIAVNGDALPARSRLRVGRRISNRIVAPVLGIEAIVIGGIRCQTAIREGGGGTAIHHRAGTQRVTRLIGGAIDRRRPAGIHRLAHHNHILRHAGDAERPSQIDLAVGVYSILNGRSARGRIQILNRQRGIRRPHRIASTASGHKAARENTRRSGLHPVRPVGVVVLVLQPGQILHCREGVVSRPIELNAAALARARRIRLENIAFGITQPTGRRRSPRRVVEHVAAGPRRALDRHKAGPVGGVANFIKEHTANRVAGIA